MCGWRHKKDDDQQAQAFGRSRDGFSTKIHINVDALGNPLSFVLTGGQSHHVTQVPSLLSGWRSDFVIADKGYDADHVIAFFEASSAIPVIPAKATRKQARSYGAHL